MDKAVDRLQSTILNTFLLSSLFLRLSWSYHLTGTKPLWLNWPNSQIPQCTCFIFHNASFRTEICIFLFWMVHCGICELGQFTDTCMCHLAPMCTNTGMDAQVITVTTWSSLAAPQVVIDLWRQTYHCDILLLVSVYWHSQVFTDMLFIEYQAVSSHSYVPVKFCHKVVHLNLLII